jgi:hypothetical protein
MKDGDSNLYIHPSTEGELIFVNSGNRPVVISSADLSYAQPKGNDEPDCSAVTSYDSARFRTDLSPTVIKPNDVLISKFKIARPLQSNDFTTKATQRKDGTFLFPVSS